MLVEHQYEDLMRHVFFHGVDKSDRTGTGTTVFLLSPPKNFTCDQSSMSCSGS